MIKFLNAETLVNDMVGSRNKRGLSPVVATVLLISIAIVIAIIIFLWARSFIGEKTQKFGSAIELACDKVAFTAEAVGGVLSIENTGDVAIYGVKVKKKGAGEISDVEVSQSSIPSGGTGTFDIVTSSGDNLIILPVLLGENGDFRQAYTCSDSYGEPIQAQ